MQKSVSVFIAVNLIAALGLGAAAHFLAPTLEDKAGYLVMPIMFLPMIMALICNKIERNPFGPFSGLQWGNTSWYFLTWILALLAGFGAIIVSLGLGAMGFDPQMGDYIAGVQAMTKEQSGQDMPEQALSFMLVFNKIASYCLPTIAVPFTAALACLSTFPWYGWLGRRLLARGRGPLVLSLAVIFMLMSSIGGLVPAPAFSGGELPTMQRVIAAMLTGVSTLPAGLWIFLRTRSAVLPAVAAASWQGTLGLATFYGSGVNFFLAPPNGLLSAAVALCAGIALWVWKDPGGDEMAVREPLTEPSPVDEREAVAAQ